MSKDVRDICGEYDPPLPERIDKPTAEDIEKLRNIIARYKRRTDVSLTKGKTYEVLSVEEGWLKIVDDTDEDYLFPPDEFDVEWVELYGKETN